MLNAKILTLFPEMFPGPLGHSLSGKALENSLWKLDVINVRDFAKDKHKTVDDTPFGGGAGMVIKPDIVSEALESSTPHSRIIFLSPRGKTLTQSLVKKLSQEQSLTLICGRYEGLDQRVIDYYKMEEISVGDYVLSGGELGAMILLDACIRLLPNAMGNEKTTDEESFENNLLEYPHYTKPAIWQTPSSEELTIPEILKSGHHKKIHDWRKQKSEEITKKRRPDLWSIYQKQIDSAD